jgi:hypothetical protein
MPADSDSQSLNCQLSQLCRLLHIELGRHLPNIEGMA